MKTITLKEPGTFERSDTDEPNALPDGHALVQVKRVGICGTDLHAFRGRQPFFSYPRILGHELGVEVLDVASGGQGVSAGDHCSVEPYLNCGTCLPCRVGRTNCCQSLQVLGVHTDGGMREQIVVPANKLHRSESLSLDQLALVETLGIGAHAVSRADVQPGENVLVIGAGPIGLSIIQFAQIAGANVAVLEMSEQRMEFCRRQFGVEHCIDARNEPVDALRTALGGELPTAVFDATGSAASMQAAFQYPESTGRLILVGIVQGDISFFDPEFHRRELTILSSRNAVSSDFDRILRFMEEGRIDTSPWITHRASYDHLIEDFPSWLEPESRVVKAMLEL
ncbi:MAG: zinc-binding alcohol dehydrogenase family protein [Planctomycetota bacterium]